MPGSVTGVEAIKAALAAFPSLVRDRSAGAIQLTAAEMVREAKRLVPVKTGTLRDHIETSFSDKSLRARVGVTTGSTKIGDTKVKGVVIAGRGGSALKREGARVLRPSHYAHLVEYGHGRAAAKPFLRPAFDGQRSVYESRMAAAMRAVPGDLANVGSSFL